MNQRNRFCFVLLQPNSDGEGWTRTFFIVDWARATVGLHVTVLIYWWIYFTYTNGFEGIGKRNSEMRRRLGCEGMWRYFLEVAGWIYLSCIAARNSFRLSWTEAWTAAHLPLFSFFFFKEMMEADFVKKNMSALAPIQNICILIVLEREMIRSALFDFWSKTDSFSLRDECKIYRRQKRGVLLQIGKKQKYEHQVWPTDCQMLLKCKRRKSYADTLMDK